MFTDWEKKLTEFEVLLTHLINRSDLITTSLEALDTKIDVLQTDQKLMKKNQDVFLHIMKRAQKDTDQFKKHDYQFKQAEKMFKACHVAFVQVRDACHCLREELSEAAGTMVTESWLD